MALCLSFVSQFLFSRFQGESKAQCTLTQNLVSLYTECLHLLSACFFFSLFLTLPLSSRDEGVVVQPGAEPSVTKVTLARRMSEDPLLLVKTITAQRTMKLSTDSSRVLTPSETKSRKETLPLWLQTRSTSYGAVRTLETQLWVQKCWLPSQTPSRQPRVRSVKTRTA